MPLFESDSQEQADQVDLPTTSIPQFLPLDSWSTYDFSETTPLTTFGEMPDHIQKSLPTDQDLVSNVNFGYDFNNIAPPLPNVSIEDFAGQQISRWMQNSFNSAIPQEQPQTQLLRFPDQPPAPEIASFLTFSPPMAEKFMQPLDSQPQRIFIDQSGHSQWLQKPQHGNYNSHYYEGTQERQLQILEGQRVYTQMGSLNPGKETPGASLSDFPEFSLDDQSVPASETKSQGHDQPKGKRRRRRPSSRGDIRDERNTQTTIQSEAKRPRQSRTLKKKLQVIAYCEQNPTSTNQEVGKHFGMPRTTVHSIKKNKSSLQQSFERGPCSSLTLETSRIVERPFRVLEEILASWVTNMQSRCIPVTGNKITAQAIEIHRMLSGLLAVPLPACTFSSGWLKLFKKRRGIDLKAMHGSDPTVHDIAHAFVELHAKLDGFDENQIYTCDITNMFVYGIQTDVFQSGNQGNRARGIDTASVSVLLSSNASGSDMRKPLIHVRGGPNLFEAKVHDDLELGAGEVELTSLVFMKWLTEFDASFDTSCHVALLVDEAVWQSFMGTWNYNYQLKRTKVIKVPRELTALMPMSNGTIRQLKINYRIISLEKRMGSDGLAADVAFEDYLRLVQQAWTQVPVSTIVQSFKRFLPPYLQAAANEPNSVRPGIINTKPSEEKLRVVLKKAKIPDYILEYYLNQDKDVGPSSFLRETILEIQLRHGFEQYFGIAGFGGVDHASGKPMAKFYMPMHYSLYLCPCSRSRAAQTIILGILPI